MPELPEVETTRRALVPAIVGQKIVSIRAGRPDLRWPIPIEALSLPVGRLVGGLSRRGKYLLFDHGIGQTLVHLGMSGSLRLTGVGTPRRPHDHVSWLLGGGSELRLNDPRRFGAVLWQRADTVHPRLASLGPEPLGPNFDGAWLHAAARGRSIAVKPFLMDASVVVGVGNIYAVEALHRAGIAPARAAGRISRARYDRLADEIRAVLERAIERGGTTLRDYVNPAGEPGWFKQELAVYGRAGQPCRQCGTAIRTSHLGQRATTWCPRCQH